MVNYLVMYEKPYEDYMSVTSMGYREIISKFTVENDTAAVEKIKAIREERINIFNELFKNRNIKLYKLLVDCTDPDSHLKENDDKI